jgi:hypothetical protein
VKSIKNKQTKKLNPDTRTQKHTQKTTVFHSIILYSINAHMLKDKGKIVSAR